MNVHELVRVAGEQTAPSVIDGAAGDPRRRRRCVVSGRPQRPTRARIPGDGRRAAEINRIAALGERRASGFDPLTLCAAVGQAHDVQVSAAVVDAGRGVESAVGDERLAGVVLGVSHEPGAPQTPAVGQPDGIELLVTIACPCPQLRADDEPVAGEPEGRLVGKALDGAAPQQTSVRAAKREEILGGVPDGRRIDTVIVGGHGHRRTQRALMPGPVDAPRPP